VDRRRRRGGDIFDRPRRRVGRVRAAVFKVRGPVLHARAESGLYVHSGPERLLDFPATRVYQCAEHENADDQTEDDDEMPESRDVTMTVADGCIIVTAVANDVLVQLRHQRTGQTVRLVTTVKKQNKTKHCSIT